MWGNIYLKTNLRGGKKHLKFCSTEALLKREQQERRRRFFNSAEQLFTVPACKSLQCPSSCCHCFPDGRKRNRKRKERDSRWWNEMQLWAVPIWAVTFWTSSSRWRDVEDLEGGCRCVCVCLLYEVQGSSCELTVTFREGSAFWWHLSSQWNNTPLKIILIHSQFTLKDTTNTSDIQLVFVKISNIYKVKFVHIQVTKTSRKYCIDDERKKRKSGDRQYQS